MTLLEQVGNPSAMVTLSLAAILCAGFIMTRLTKKLRLPDVTGYILAGILIGPYVLHLIPEEVAHGMDFVTDIALAYIAFGVGKYFKLTELQKNGKRIIVITLFEALAAAAAVSLSMIFLFHLPIPFSLLLGAIGSATAPASTIMTIRQYHAKGELVSTILQVVALDDAVALVAFSICAAIADELESGSGHLHWMVLIQPILLNLLAIALGAGCGFLLKWIISARRTRDHRLILINAVIFAVAGTCSIMDISPLLACMAMGAIYINAIGDKDLFKQVNHFTPPFMLLFFVLSGMRLDIPMLATAGGIGIVYFFVRILGKYAGAYAGSLLGKAPVQVRRYLGLALVPQAGVSIGLAALGQRLLPPSSGSLLTTIILSSGVLYEMVGPACAKASLFLSGSVPEKREKKMEAVHQADQAGGKVQKKHSEKGDTKKEPVFLQKDRLTASVPKQASAPKRTPKTKKKGKNGKTAKQKA